MWHSFWGFLWSAIVVFAFIAYLLILFNIIVDLFWRDHQTPGWAKAIWVVFLIVFPYLTALIYLIARGESMAVRARGQTEGQLTERSLWPEATTRTPAQEIAHAKELLDEGTITQPSLTR
jgi:hypothetical protein